MTAENGNIKVLRVWCRTEWWFENTVQIHPRTGTKHKTVLDTLWMYCTTLATVPVNVYKANEGPTPLDSFHSC